MNSRENILKSVKEAQPTLLPLPALNESSSDEKGSWQQFKGVLESIGGSLYELNSNENIVERLAALFPEAKRIVSSIFPVEEMFLKDHQTIRHHSLEDVDVVVIGSSLGVAENGSVWVTEEETKIRVLPFIGAHLVVVLDEKNIVATMKEAYEKIGHDNYHFGVFIAGPSKTADIEQSLVLGAHGPKTMTILLAM